MSTDLEPIDYDQSGSRADYLARDDNALSATLFGTDNPAEVVARAAVVATALADLVHKQNLVVPIGQSEHVRVEGWTLLGSMLGVFPVVTWTRPILVEDGQPELGYVGWEARVEARTRQGEVVGAAESECLRTENTWRNRDDYALRSMAQTRAVSKALRLPLGFVMQLAGFNPTPAEELPTIDMADPDIPFGDSAVGTQPPKYITEKQRTRLWTIAQNAGVDEHRLRQMVQLKTGQTSTKKIKVGREYDQIVAALESAGDPTNGTALPSAVEHSEDAPVPQAVSGEPASPADDIARLTAMLVGKSKRAAATATALEAHAAAHPPEKHLAWLRAKAAQHMGVDA